MAANILSNSSSKLNLSREQADVLVEIIFAGSQMACTINRYESSQLFPELVEAGKTWSDLLVRLVETFV